MSGENRITLGGRPFKPVEVDVYGTLFNTVPVTRSLGEKTDEHFVKLAELTKADEVVALIGEIVNEYLVPASGGKKKPSTIISEKWKSNELSLPELNGLLADLTEAAERRPT